VGTGFQGSWGPAGIAMPAVPRHVPLTLMTPLDVISRFGPHGGTLTSMLRARVASRGAHPFLEFAGSSLTYAAFEDKVARVAGMLASRGIREGDRIGLMSFNHPVIPLTLFAAARLGAVAVPVNPEFLKDEAAYVLGHAGVSALICSPDCIDVAVAATQGMDHRPWIMTHGAAAVVGASHERPDFEGELERTTLRITDDHGRADSTVILVYSSGTTGFPKGVMHCQRTLCLSGEAFVARVDIKPDARMLVMMPMFHMNAVFYSLAGTLAAGATLVILPRFSASTFWKDVAATQVTHVNTIAAMSNILMRRPRSEFVAGHCLRTAYGGPFSSEVYRVFEEEFGVPTMIEGYGMTEIPGVFSNPVHGRRLLGSMGIPSRHPDERLHLADVRIVDDEGVDVADEVAGNLLVRTPLVMQGYYKDAEQTAAAFDGDWFRTGDVVRRDASGYYWFIARSRDIIRRRGENVSGAEVDRTINEHPDVLLSAAIGVPSPLGEEDILVAVLPKQGATVTPRQVHEWCSEKLARIKVPRYVAIVDELPQNRSFRVEKFKLKSRTSELVDAAHDFEAKPQGSR
jgi:crotonobetaine/carnitine-CoA ligase